MPIKFHIYRPGAQGRNRDKKLKAISSSRQNFFYHAFPRFSMPATVVILRIPATLMSLLKKVNSLSGMVPLSDTISLVGMTEKLSQTERKNTPLTPSLLRRTQVSKLGRPQDHLSALMVVI